MSEKPIYILGTGLSHNGSAVLLKDGKICVGIEKERITRKKHDGGNDSDAIRYCLEAEGISLEDVSLVVQCANFEVPARDRFHGERIFAGKSHPPMVSISHHLAHAYSAAGTCPFDECAILVIDGCGSPLDQCADLDKCEILSPQESPVMHCEKDSFYHFDGQKLTALIKDFSPLQMQGDRNSLKLPTTQHSIGGFYAAISHYVFGNLDDAGKLMGLAPYGNPATYDMQAFEFSEGMIRVSDQWQSFLDRPSDGYKTFQADFEHYANVAAWAQQQIESAVIDCFRDRLQRFPHTQVCFSGGVALNAVANARLLNEKVVESLYLEPAAGDNGLALGCAFYGWLEVMDKPKVPHDGNTCFGKTYPDELDLEESELESIHILKENEMLEMVAEKLSAGKTVGWFQGGSEFGPRALGHRSILAHPGIAGLNDHINANIKFREDFRPFAPAVLSEYATEYFVSGRKSPYMILVDRTKPEYLETLQNVTHVNGTARVQTVDGSWNAKFEKLLKKFHQVSGVPVLLNTSFNKKGMPMVERPEEALELFRESALDVLVVGNTLIEKRTEKSIPMNDKLVTQLKFPISFDAEKLKEDLARALEYNWIAHYNPKDYSGDWNVIALMSSGGKSERIEAFPIGGIKVEQTQVLRDCPYFQEVIDSFQCDKTTARLMRLEVGAEIMPHTDYCVGYEDGLFRIHIPVVTNPDVEFIIAGERVVMEEGTCWYINANEEHSVANRGSQDRIHLVIDGIRNEWTDKLFFSQAPEANFKRPPKPLSDSEKRMVLEELKKQTTPGSIALAKKLEAELNIGY